MNKRQRKKAQKRVWERLEKLSEKSHRKWIHWLCNNSKHPMAQHNLRVLAANGEQEG